MERGEKREAASLVAAAPRPVESGRGNPPFARPALSAPATLPTRERDSRGPRRSTRQGATRPRRRPPTASTSAGSRQRPILGLGAQPSSADGAAGSRFARARVAPRAHAVRWRDWAAGDGADGCEAGSSGMMTGALVPGAVGAGAAGGDGAAGSLSAPGAASGSGAARGGRVGRRHPPE